MSLAQTLALLDDAPRECAVALLLRHAARDESSDPPPNHAPLTEAGRMAARELGLALAGMLHSVAHSPVARCRETALQLLAGAGHSRPCRVDPMLGGPGPFVASERIASASFAAIGVVGVMQALMAGHDVAGFVPAHEGAQTLLSHLVASLGHAEAGVRVFVTHDALLAPTQAWLFGPDVALPGYLAGLMVWIDGRGRIRARGAGHERVIDGLVGR